MIIGIGIDITEVARFRRWLEDEALLSRYFSPQEIEDVRNKGDRQAESLAGRFAAKEAFAKAMGTGFRNMGLRDLTVWSDRLGKPSIEMNGPAELLFHERGGQKVFLSISHEESHAVAMVVVEGV
ncbi:MAG: holo-ACP synthase [Alkalispirochaetaceae bacterium]